MLKISLGVVNNPSNAEDNAQLYEKLLEGNGWEGLWRDTVYPYQHYHSTAHEVFFFIYLFILFLFFTSLVTKRGGEDYKKRGWEGGEGLKSFFLMLLSFHLLYLLHIS